MKVTGYALRSALRSWEMRRDTAFSQFTPALKRFDNDPPSDTPHQVSVRFLECERVIASLQVAQARYNLAVSVVVEDGAGVRAPHTLAYLIKNVGGLGRMEKAWRGVATGASGASRYSYNDTDVRDPNQIRAKDTVSRAEAARAAEILARQAGRMRQAIAEANSTPLEVEGLEEAWFD